MRIVQSTPLVPTGTDGNAAGPVATPSTGAGDVSVIHQRQVPNAVGPHHSHDREEVLYLLTGAVSIQTGEYRHSLRQGDAAIIPGGVVHRIETTSDVPAEWLLVATSGVGFFNTEGTPVTPPWSA